MVKREKRIENRPSGLGNKKGEKVQLKINQMSSSSKPSMFSDLRIWSGSKTSRNMDLREQSPIMMSQSNAFHDEIQFK